MDTIVTPVTVITLDSTRIVHSIKADLVARYFPPVVRLVQYDQSLPVIAVSLMQNGQAYTLPSGAAANIRVHKPDSTYVYNPALGCDSTRKIVYFEVTQAMAAASGDGLAIVEIVVDGDIAGTSLITLHFEENPVPEDAIESSDEWETIYELGERIIASTVTPVSTAAGMTDHNVVYLYTGTESGWNQGHMYYYNGTTWVDAGIAVTDTTLSVAGLAADAKKTGDEIATVKDGLEQLETDLTNTINSVYATDTASGSIASFTDGADGVPVKSLTVDIEPIQSGSGDPSPTNIRPISGHTQAVVTRTGKNLAEVTFVGAYNTTTGAKAPASTSTYASTDKFKVNPSTAYVCSAGFTITQLLVWYWDASGTYLRFIVVNSGTTFTTPSDAQYCAVSFRKGSDGSSVSDFPNTQVENGSTATAYEPYNGQQYTIDLDGTRYGGMLNVETGVLTVDRVGVDMGALSWGYNSTYSFVYSGISGKKIGSVNVLCEKYKTLSTPVSSDSQMGTKENKTVSAGAANAIIFIKDTAYSDAASFKTAMNGVQLVYELATPQSIQLTANDVTTLLGQNNIWNDCGGTEVEYRADTKMYIEKLTAPTEDDMIADHAISADTFFMVGNSLYRATTAIASGATITVGTNATRLSLADALNTLS